MSAVSILARFFASFMALTERNFPSKLLLFGEHVLLLGATALAVPIRQFGGRWAWATPDEAAAKQQGLSAFAASEHLRTCGVIDERALLSDLEKGLYFESNIPTGYGLGSSGAVCAAIFHRYALQKTDDLMEIKRWLACMESYFHGNSSGIDPLTSWVDAPIMIRQKTDVTRAPIRDWPGGEQPEIFLLDSNLPRRTGPLVEWFLEQQSNPVFREMLEGQYLPSHESAIAAWLDGNASDFWYNLNIISALQLRHFHPMVPETIRSFWTEHLDHADFKLKICGAGGGGFVLGFAKNNDVLKHLKNTFPALIHIPQQTALHTPEL